MPSNREIIHGWCCSGRETPNAAESAAMLAVMGPRLTHTVPELSVLPVSGPEPINGTETITLSPLQVDTMTESADVE
jgi:hypothetical protein